MCVTNQWPLSRAVSWVVTDAEPVPDWSVHERVSDRVAWAAPFGVIRNRGSFAARTGIGGAFRHSVWTVPNPTTTGARLLQAFSDGEGSAAPVNTPNRPPSFCESVSIAFRSGVSPAAPVISDASRPGTFAAWTIRMPSTVAIATATITTATTAPTAAAAAAPATAGVNTAGAPTSPA